MFYCINSEIAINQDKLSMYNGTRKTEFLEKGYCKYSHINYAFILLLIQINSIYYSFVFKTKEGDNKTICKHGTFYRRRFAI